MNLPCDSITALQQNEWIVRGDIFEKCKIYLRADYTSVTDPISLRKVVAVSFSEA